MLETDYVLFRGDFRVKAVLKELKSVEAREGILKLQTPDGPLLLELGPAAAKWADKIQHPPSRLDKLGVKASSEVALIGDFDSGFEQELRERTPLVVNGKPGSPRDLLFLACGAERDLAKVETLVQVLKPAGALWVVYPKGIKEITEMDVLNGVRAAGLADTKVVSFSPTHTALRFVIRVADRVAK